MRVFNRLNVDTSNLVDGLSHIELTTGDFLNGIYRVRFRILI